ncbi:organic cation/carnitine transporter 2-like [Dunckerocampus dactyliophorus]|uniref:organic cation/carnitine transporter 2-like n=1 Tax=Dunckerocampus dactyliophorus TaxID=161453 RepID=UPI002404AFD2|nr:organic cation/carnitine transporter 2-like [Dunckerocampus dactyliophorus]
MMQDYEDLVSFLKTWGPYQRRVLSLLCLAVIPTGYNVMSPFFLLATPVHTCSIPAHANLSQDWIQTSIPVQLVEGHMRRSSCHRFELAFIQNQSALGLEPGPGPGLDVLLSGLKQEVCKDGWTFSKEHYESTVVTEFSLVCEDEWKAPLTSFAYFLGGLCGCFISGQISDRVGRKPVLLGSIAMLSIFSSALALAPSWEVFTILFFMLGLGQISCYVIIFVLGSEILMGPTRVLFSSLVLPFSYVLGMLLLPGTAYLTQTWRLLALILAVPGLACVPLWWLLPESPRWLASHGRQREAEILLRSAALENRVEAPQIIFNPAKVENPARHKSRSVGFLDMLRTRKVRHVTLILWLVWFSLNVSYFGTSFNMSGLNGNPFLTYFSVSLVELPSYAASWLAVRYLHRRLSFAGFSLLGALALLLIQITMNSHPQVTLFLVMVGKFGVLAGISVLYTYSGELYPTVIRNTAMSSCATFSRMASSVSPYLLQLAVFSQYLPWIIVGSLSVLGVVLCVFLPETFSRPLPDTIQQMAPTQRCPCTPCGANDEVKPAEDQTSMPEIVLTSHF